MPTTAASAVSSLCIVTGPRTSAPTIAASAGCSLCTPSPLCDTHVNETVTLFGPAED